MFRFLAIVFFVGVFSLPARAETPYAKMQMLFIGAEADQDAPGDVPADLPVIALDRLPEIAAAQQTVFAARLRASPVSTFVSGPDDANSQFDQFFLVTKVGLTTGADGHRLTLGGDDFTLAEYADRVSAVVDAFQPKHRRIGLVHMSDPEDAFPLAIADVQTALKTIGFDLVVVMIGDSAETCNGAGQALHYSLISGLADRAPFGDGNGISTSAEVESYLSNALNRMTARDPGCGPKYSVLLKGSNADNQELVAYQGRAAFTEIETRLYNETFEARFLLASDDRDRVQEFLASCLYCPNEGALTDRLQTMDEHARTSALEADIWARIKEDEDTARLTIYLESCTLCAFEDEANERISRLNAIAAAFEAEAAAYQQAAAVRDVGSLRSYVQNCVACTYQRAAQDLVAEIEADEAYQTEVAAFQAALDSRDITLMRTFLENCAICEGKDQLTAALQLEEKRLAFATPCFELAALPQMGGPRRLEEINANAAVGACNAAAEAFPEDGEIQTTLGRIAQAEGDFDKAEAAYAAGMDKDVPSAFGLAAYTYYAPPEGRDIDLIEAENLATIGAGKGDWLSKEILTVLYSRELSDAKTPEDGFQIALDMANEGNVRAEFFVGTYYLTGTGTQVDGARAEEWLQKAVDNGYTTALPYLAEVHETGINGVKDIEKAADLYWTALKAKDETTIERLTVQLNSRDDGVVREIQQKMRDEGSYRGAVDGIGGNSTVSAIRRVAEES